MKVKESESGCHLQIVAGVSVSFSNSSTAEEPIGLKCILDKICLSFILAEKNLPHNGITLGSVPALN